MDTKKFPYSLTTKRFFEDLRGNQGCMKQFFGELRERKFQAYYFETPGMNSRTMNSNFEFVLMNAPALTGRRPDPHSFADHFQKSKSHETVVVFQNLGGDATLVAPKPQHGINPQIYSHLSSFMLEAPQKQVEEFWRKAATTALDLGNQGSTVWMSTAGGGVPWLHLRFDNQPKYYNHGPYKKADSFGPSAGLGTMTGSPRTNDPLWDELLSDNPQASNIGSWSSHGRGSVRGPPPTYHVSCRSERWGRKKDPEEQYVGIVLLSRYGQRDWRVNGFHCKTGYIVFLKSSTVQHQSDNHHKTLHYTAYHHIFSEAPTGVEAIGFSFRSDCGWKGTSQIFDQQSHKDEMSPAELKDIKQQLRTWNNRF